MDVFLLVHDDRVYDMGDTFVRGVYATHEAATAAIVTRTAAGRPSRAYGAHTASCCSIETFELLDAPLADVREDDPPPTGKPLFSPAFTEYLVQTYLRPKRLLDLMKDDARIGTVVDVSEDEAGLTIEAKLD